MSGLKGGRIRKDGSAASFRLNAPSLELEVRVRLRPMHGRWAAIAVTDGQITAGIGHNPREALAASLSSLGKLVSATLMADPALFGVSARLLASSQG